LLLAKKIVLSCGVVVLAFPLPYYTINYVENHKMLLDKILCCCWQKKIVFSCGVEVRLP
jgi:hypothetical protein